MSAKKTPASGVIAVSLTFLLSVICLIVLRSPPAPKTPPEQRQLLELHQSMMYFYDAEDLAKKIAPDPSLQWSQQFIDAHTGCWSLGNGVWYASGSVQSPADHVREPTIWEVCFSTEGGPPIFVRVGSSGSGDFKTALKAAAERGAKLNGARVEK